MPMIRRRVSATTADAMNGVQFNTIPARGALANLFVAGVTATDSYGLSVGSTVIIVNGTTVNIEASADVLDNDRDQVLFNEPLPGGQQFMPFTLTTEDQFLEHLRYA